MFVLPRLFSSPSMAFGLLHLSQVQPGKERERRCELCLVETCPFRSMIISFLILLYLIMRRRGNCSFEEEAKRVRTFQLASGGGSKCGWFVLGLDLMMRETLAINKNYEL